MACSLPLGPMVRRCGPVRRGASVVVVGALLGALAGLAASTVVTPPSAAAQTQFTLSGGGFGHGVGMSQYGAKGRADAGQSTADILAAYYPGAALAAVPTAGPRVKLGDAAGTELSVDGGRIYATPDGGATGVIAEPGDRVSVRAFGSAVIYQRVAPTLGPIGLVSGVGVKARVTFDAGRILTVSATGRSYAYGSLRLLPSSGSLGLVLDGMTMQEYLFGLGEMPSSWHLEALKAQAVAGRTFAAHRIANPRSAPDYDMLASTSDQAYIGTTQVGTGQGLRWAQAVVETDQLMLMWGGQPIIAFYSSSNGGHTERNEYVNVATLAYSTAIPDPWDLSSGNPNGTWTRTYSGEELGSWLAAAGRGNVGTATGLSIGGNVGVSGRVDRATVTVSGTLGTITMTGNQFRSAVNARAGSGRTLLSTKFAVGAATPPPVAPPPPPADTTPPNLTIYAANPARFGSTGTFCVILASDEVAISAVQIYLDGADLRSRVGGVGPTFPQVMCITIPQRLRFRGTRVVTMTAAALDAAGNMRFHQQWVALAR